MCMAIFLLLSTASESFALPECPADPFLSKFDCSGSYTFENGDQYVGEFRGGKKHGLGIYTFANGNKKEGIWIKDKFQYARSIEKPDARPSIAILPICDGSPLEITKFSDFANWSICKGTFFASPESGFAGDNFVGEFLGGKMHGQGTYTSASGDKYIGEIARGKLHGKGTFHYKNGDEYTGEFALGKKHGRGVFKFIVGSTYNGEFINDKIHGHGTYSYLDGSVYVGEFARDKKHGQGTYSFSNGDKYVGDWKHDQMHGQGTYTYKNGDKYVGEHLDGLAHGQGTYTYKNGAKYVGEVSNNRFHGKGIFTFPDGRIQEGVWKENNLQYAQKIESPVASLPVCRGSPLEFTNSSKFAGWHNCEGSFYASPDSEFAGDIFVGEFRNGKAHGQGSYTAANGDKYVGEFKDGQGNGLGTYSYANGSIYVGEIKNNQPNGQGEFLFGPSTKWAGDIFVGEFKDAKHNGVGTYKFANGDKYVGEFKDGQPNGLGTYTFASGAKYVGENRNGKNYGLGTYTFKNGDKYVGGWKDGQSEGHGTFTFAKGQKYIGEHKGNQPNGLGAYWYPDGAKYVGEFSNNRYHGKGIYTFSDGRIQEGVWKEGKFQYAEKITPDDKSITENQSEAFEGAEDKKRIQSYTALYEEDGRSVLFISKQDDGLSSGTIVQYGGYKWLKNAFDTEPDAKVYVKHPKVHVTPAQFTQTGNRESYFQDRYQVEKFEFKFIEDKHSDQILHFYSAEAILRISGHIQNNEIFAISGLSKKGWYAGTFYPIKTDQDLKTFAELNSVSFCNFVSTGMVKNTYNQYLKTENIKLYLENIGVSCDKNENLIITDNSPWKNPKDRTKDVYEGKKLKITSSGTGFFVSENGEVITNYHVIKNCEQIYSTKNNSNYLARVLAVDKRNDLALLGTDLKNVSGIVLDANNPQISESIFALGYPFGKAISSSVKITKGIVSALTGLGDDYGRFQIDAAIQPGSSGGPIINSDGYLVGVTVSKLNAALVYEKFGALPENINFGVKLSSVKNLLNAHGIKYQTRNASLSIKEDISKIMNESVVYISCYGKAS